MESAPLLSVEGDGPSGVIDQIRTTTPGSKSGFDRTFFRRFARLWKLGFGSCDWMLARAFIVWTLSIGSTLVTFALGQMGASFLAKIIALDAAAAFSIFLMAFGILLVQVILTIIVMYMSAVLALDWRAKIVAALQARYFHGKANYWLNCIDGRVDNADQRITEDVAQLTNVAGSVLFGGFAQGNTGSMVSVLFQALVAVVFVLTKIDAIPLMISLGFVLLSFIITTLLIIPVARATYRVNQGQGNFRFFHSRVREYSECITIFQGFETEQAAAHTVFEDMYWKFRALFKRQFFLRSWSQFQSSFGGVVGILSIMVIIQISGGLLYGAAPTSENVQGAVVAVDNFLEALATIPALYSICGALAGYAHRVGQLFEALDELEVTEDRVQRGEGQGKRVESSEVQLQNVEFHAPGGQRILHHLSFKVQPGRSMLIMGPSGSGKSSLLRVIAGLWPFDEGFVQAPESGARGMFFVPQRPYVVLGSLRDQVLYPLPTLEQQSSDAAVISVLEAVGLAHLLASAGGLDAVHDWDSMLSVGEQQRLGFARLLYHKPPYAIMDEATSAMEEELQARCMRLALDARITCISVGHRPSLVSFHEDILLLDGNGSYNVMSTPQYLDSLGLTLAALSDRPLIANANDTQSVLDDAAASFAESRTTSRFSVVEGDNLSIGPAEEEPALIPAPKEDVSNRMQLNLSALRKTWRLLTIGFPQFFSKPTGVLIVAIVVNSAGAIVLVAAQFIIGPMLQATVNRDYSNGLLLGLVATAVVAALALFTNWANWLGDMLQLYWYKALVLKAQASYLRGRVLYGANHLAPDLDNMDQRICEDCRSVTQLLSQIFFGAQGMTAAFQTVVTLVVAITQAVSYGYIAITSACAYTVLCLFISWFLGKRVVPAQYIQNKAEGDFRHSHLRFREFNESIAFYNGAERESKSATHRFQTVYDLSIKLIRSQMPIYGFTQFSGAFTGISAYALLAILAIPARNIGGLPVNFSNLVTAAGLLVAVLTSASNLPAYLTVFSSATGYVHRVDNMLNTIENLNILYSKFENSHRLEDGSDIQVSEVDLRIPAGRELLHHVSFQVKSGSSLVIMGPSGCGKSSLVRLICGLWPFEAGHVQVPLHIGNGGLYVLPQRPYITKGTLRDLLLYPHNGANRDPKAGSDEHLIARLHEMGLPHLLRRGQGGLDAVEMWADMLSVGEQQRVGFVRLLYHRPAFAILDEATSALDIAMETKCMDLCVQSQITLVSVAHRPTLARYHQRLLLLDGRGGFKLHDLSH